MSTPPGRDARSIISASELMQSKMSPFKTRAGAVFMMRSNEPIFLSSSEGTMGSQPETDHHARESGFLVLTDTKAPNDVIIGMSVRAILP